jgi:uncharacterized protein YceK
MRNITLLIAFGFLVGGCAVAARVDARKDYQVSTDNYKQCLAAHAAAPRECEGLRLAMEADERKYNNLSAGLTPGSQNSSNITVLSR